MCNEGQKEKKKSILEYKPPPLLPLLLFSYFLAWTGSNGPQRKQV
jgi:hypothetical protein